jgi:hypothetical protein
VVNQSACSSFGGRECKVEMKPDFVELADTSFGGLMDLTDPFGVNEYRDVLNPILEVNGLYPITYQNMKIAFLLLKKML